ncbi:unnamed protein product, partial [Sphagnum jensenii]
AKSFEEPVSDAILTFLANCGEAAPTEREAIDFSREGITSIRACMAYGKTTQMFEYIKSQPDARVLIVTPRVALATEFRQRFGPLGFAHYQDDEDAFKPIGLSAKWTRSTGCGTSTIS